MLRPHRLHGLHDCSLSRLLPPAASLHHGGEGRLSCSHAPSHSPCCPPVASVLALRGAQWVSSAQPCIAWISSFLVRVPFVFAGDWYRWCHQTHRQSVYYACHLSHRRDWTACHDKPRARGRLHRLLPAPVPDPPPAYQLPQCQPSASAAPASFHAKDFALLRVDLAPPYPAPCRPHAGPGVPSVRGASTCLCRLCIFGTRLSF